MFCEEHAGEYNRGYDYFEGLTKEEAEEREANERRDSSGYKESAHYGWAGSGDGSRSRDEMHALDILGLESDTNFEDAKKAGNADAAKAFQAGQAAYDVLRVAEERRAWKG
jgi:hypothetical protein